MPDTPNLSCTIPSLFVIIFRLRRSRSPCVF